MAQSCAPEDGQNNCPKHVELIGIINKQLFLHLVGITFVGHFLQVTGQKKGWLG
jgi:hypothetical protein